MTPKNMLIIQGREFTRGVGDAVQFNEHSELVLEEGRTQGSFLSEVRAVQDFTDVVASWNSSTPEGTFIELSVRVRKDTCWSQWFSYGKWSDNGRNTGMPADQHDDIARFEMGMLRVLEGEADAIQYKFNLTRENSAIASPRVRLAAFALPPAEHADNVYTSEEVALDVPPRAQLSVPVIGNRICSPTSLAMVMAYHGHVEDTEQAAAGVRDNGAGIYGSWTYNVAYASEKGFTAWVQRCNSMEDVKQYLLQGLPIVASIKIAAKEDLEGALMAYPSGHLVVITGLSHKDGQDYVLVNDPAAHGVEEVPRRYKLDQFVRAWTRKGIYVLTHKAD